MRNLIHIRATVLALALTVLAGSSFGFAQNGNTPARGTKQYEQWLTREVRHELVIIPWLRV